MASMTVNKNLALGACAIIVASTGVNLSTMTQTEVEVMNNIHKKAVNLLWSTGLTPTELKDLGIEIILENKP